MARIKIEQSHQVTADEARKRLDQMNQDLSDKYGLNVKWHSDTEARVERTGVTGTIKIEAQKVLVDLDLAFMLSPLKGTIENRIRDELKRVFS